MENDNNNKIQNIEVKKVKVKKEPKSVQLKHSNWLLTINSNKNMCNMNKEEYDSTLKSFTAVVDEFFNKKITDFVILSGSKLGIKFGLPINDTHENLLKRITEAKVEYVVEIGPESHKLHTHGMLCLSKKGLDTRLDYQKIRDHFEKELGYSIHFNAQLFHDAKSNMTTYMLKAPVI